MRRQGTSITYLGNLVSVSCAANDTMTVAEFLISQFTKVYPKQGIAGRLHFEYLRERILLTSFIFMWMILRRIFVAGIFRIILEKAIV
jgi:hypothetical protein